MIYRECAEGNDIKIYFGPIYSRALATAREYPDKRYLVWASGAIVLETDDFSKAEDAYIKECNKQHPSGGRFVIGQHKLEKNVVSII